jgi:Domain of unknown function (DUF4267)
MTPITIAGGVLAAALVAVGLAALFAPHPVARLYGLPADGDAARGFVRATGIRDVVIGIVLAAAAYVRDVPLVVVVAVAGVAISVADAFIAYHSGGKRWRPEHGIHAAGAIAFALVLAMALFAIGV